MSNIKILFYDITLSNGLINLDSLKNDSMFHENYASFTFTENTTIQDLLDATQPYACLSLYYNLSKTYCFNEHFFPYIITVDNKIMWNLSYMDTRVIDFIYTHQIDDGIIFAEVGMVQAGGMGFKEIAELWQDIQIFIGYLANCIANIKDLLIIIDKIKDYYIKKNIPPQSVLDLIYSKDEWNLYQISEHLGLPVDHGKHLLKGLGYKWN